MSDDDEATYRDALGELRTRAMDPAARDRAQVITALAEMVASGSGGRHSMLQRPLAEQVERVTAELAEARQWAWHGYEIGQRSATWSDHGVAPRWLLDGPPGAEQWPS